MSGIEIAIALISRPDFEGLRLAPYICPAGCWTIGYGNTALADGSPVTAATRPLTEAGATALLRQTVTKLRAELRSFVTVPLSDCQEGALLSWQFNIGTDAACKSTLVQLLNQKRYDEAAQEFLRWNRAKVKGRLTVLRGLTHRRRTERDVFIGLTAPTPDESPPS